MSLDELLRIKEMLSLCVYAVIVLLSYFWFWGGSLTDKFFIDILVEINKILTFLFSIYYKSE